MESVKILFIKILFLFHAFLFFSGIFYLLSALHTNCFPANPLWTLFISIYSYSLSSLPSCEYLVCFQQNNLLSAASIVVFISRSPSLISFVSSCFTSYCLAKYFLNYSISILFCLRSWLFFFLRYLLHCVFFFFFFLNLRQYVRSDISSVLWYYFSGESFSTPIICFSFFSFSCVDIMLVPFWLFIFKQGKVLLNQLFARNLCGERAWGCILS